MNTTNHIKYFKVKNFKKFNTVELDNLGLFNLITGDNGVGKTSLLESFLLETNAINTLSNLNSAVRQRLKNTTTRSLVEGKMLSDYYLHDAALNEIEVTREYDGHSELISSKYSIKMLNELSDSDLEDSKSLFFFEGKYVLHYLDTIGNKSFAVCSDESLTHHSSNYYPFIPFHVGYQDDLIGFYSQHIQKNRELNAKFIKDLSVLIDGVEEVMISADDDSKNGLYIWKSGVEKPLPLGMLGEGAVRLFRILCEIILCRGKILMIDEIDTGIHYSRFEPFLSTIIASAISNDVQVFATTHSLECIKYFANSLQTSNFDELRERYRVLSLIEDVNGEVQVLNYRYDEFDYSIRNNIEIRGGRK